MKLSPPFPLSLSPSLPQKASVALEEVPRRLVGRPDAQPIVATNVFERREYYSSLYKRSQAEHREWIAKIHAEYDDAVPRQQALIDHGRYWGMHEDWRKTARNRGGPPSWRQVSSRRRDLFIDSRVDTNSPGRDRETRRKERQRARLAFEKSSTGFCSRYCSV